MLLLRSIFISFCQVLLRICFDSYGKISWKMGGAEPGGAEPGGAEPGGAEPGGAEPGGAEPGGAEPGGAEPGVEGGETVKENEAPWVTGGVPPLAEIVTA